METNREPFKDQETTQESSLVSVSLKDETLFSEIDEIAEEYQGIGVTGEQQEDGSLFLTYEFHDSIEAQEFHEFLAGSDWFGEEIVSVAIQNESYTEGQGEVSDTSDDNTEEFVDDQDEVSGDELESVDDEQIEGDSEEYGFDGIEEDPNEYEFEEVGDAEETKDMSTHRLLTFDDIRAYADQLYSSVSEGDDEQNEYNLTVLDPEEESPEGSRFLTMDDLSSYAQKKMNVNPEFEEFSDQIRKKWGMEKTERSEEDDTQDHIEQQESDRDEYRKNFVPDVGRFEEDVDVFNVQGQGGESVKNDFSQRIQELKELAGSIVQATLLEYRAVPYNDDATEYKDEDEKDNTPHRFKNVIAKNGEGWDKIQSSTDQYTDSHDDHKAGQQIDDFHAKNRQVKILKKQGDIRESIGSKVVDTIDGTGKGWDDIQKSSSEDSSVAQMEETKKQTKAFFSRKHKVPFAKDVDLKEHDMFPTARANPRLIHCIMQYWNGRRVVADLETEQDCEKFFKKHGVKLSDTSYNKHANEYVYVQGDLRESLDEVIDESLDETVDETIDEMSDCAGIGGYTVPLGAKPANMKRNADVWRKNSGSKTPKANDTVRQNQAPVKSSTSVKKDPRKAKKPFTQFADQTNVPFKHKHAKTKYGVSDSPASAIGGE